VIRIERLGLARQLAWNLVLSCLLPRVYSCGISRLLRRVGILPSSGSSILRERPGGAMRFDFNYGHAVDIAEHYTNTPHTLFNSTNSKLHCNQRQIIFLSPELRPYHCEWAIDRQIQHATKLRSPSILIHVAITLQWSSGVLSEEIVIKRKGSMSLTQF